MIKVSIIIPVYNGSDHIARLLKSILNQSLREIEVIVVDDNSNDNTSEIVDKIKSNDSRIKFFKNDTNLGAGISRNFGLSKARGKFVFFADADDMLDINGLNDVYYQIDNEQADIGFLNYSLVLNKSQSTQHKLTQLYYNQSTNKVNNILVQKNVFQFYNWVPWNRIYRREYLLNLELKYQNIKSANDLYFGIVSVLKAKKMIYIKSKNSMYYYYNNKNEFQISSLYRANYENFNLAMKEVKKNLCSEEINIICKSYNSCILTNYFYYKRRSIGYEYSERKMLAVFMDSLIANEENRVEFLNRNDLMNYTRLAESLINDNELTPKENEKYDLDENLLNILFKTFAANRVCVWGIGKYGKRFIDTSRKHGFNINNLVDQRSIKVNLEYRGISIRNVEEGLRECTIVFYTNQHIGEDIVKVIKSLDNSIKAFDLYAYFQLETKLEECIIEIK